MNTDQNYQSVNCDFFQSFFSLQIQPAGIEEQKKKKNCFRKKKNWSTIPLNWFFWSRLYNNCTIILKFQENIDNLLKLRKI